MKIIIVLIFLIGINVNSFSKVRDSVLFQTIENEDIKPDQFDLSIDLYRSLNDSANLANSFERKADHLKSYSSAAAIVYYKKAIELRGELGQIEDVVRLSQLVANAFYDNQEYDNALIKSYQLLRYYEQKDDTLKVAQTHSLIGSIYGDMHNRSLSYKHLKTALDLSVALKSKQGMAAISNNIAGLFVEIDSFHRALYYARQAEAINKETGNEYWLNINYMQYADIYLDQGVYDSCRYYLFKSKEFIEREGSRIDSTYLIRKLGVYYYYVDSMSIAIQFFNKGVLLSHEMNNISIEANFVHWLSEVYESQGDEVIALALLQEYNSLMDSISDQKSKQDLIAFQVLYDVNELENELSTSLMEQKNAEREVVKINTRLYGLLFICLLTLIFGGFLFVLLRKYYRSNQHLLDLNLMLNDKELSQADKYANSNLKDEKKNQILSAFLQLIVEEEIFKDQALKLDVVAERLDVSRTYLSQVINETYEQNFNAYINSCRIKLSKKYMVSSDYSQYSIQGIAELVGFKSLSAFNVAFKKNTGLTPSYFRKKQR